MISVKIKKAHLRKMAIVGLALVLLLSGFIVMIGSNNGSNNANSDFDWFIGTWYIYGNNTIAFFSNKTLLVDGDAGPHRGTWQLDGDMFIMSLFNGTSVSRSHYHFYDDYNRLSLVETSMGIELLNCTKQKL